MTKDDHITQEQLAALRQRFQAQSQKAQAYYTVMHSVRGVVGNDDAASAWMEKPLEAFKGKTPAQLVGNGQTEEVLAYIGTLKPGVP